jgi:hypothetical protein
LVFVTAFYLFLTAQKCLDIFHGNREMADILNPLPDPGIKAESPVSSEPGEDNLCSSGSVPEAEDKLAGSDEETKSNSNDASNLTEDTLSATGNDELDGDVNDNEQSDVVNDSEQSAVINDTEQTAVINDDSENEQGEKDTKEMSTQAEDKSSDVDESLNEKTDDKSGDEVVTETKVQTDEEEEEGIEINESDIVKATDVFGKGKRQHVKKVDGEFTEDYDIKDSSPQHRYSMSSVCVYCLPFVGFIIDTRYLA